MDTSPQFSLPHEVSEASHFLTQPGHVMVWTCDVHGQCDFVSPSWLAFTGRDMRHEVGNGWLDRVHPDDLETVVHAITAAVTGHRPFQVLYRYLRADDTFRWIVNQGVVRTTPADGFRGYIGQCFDVTSYQERANETDLSAQLMMDLLKQTRLIAVVLDHEGRILFSNGSLCRLLQQDEVEIANVRLFERYLALESSNLLAKLHRSGANVLNFPSTFESAIQTGKGEIRHVLWHAISLREAGDRNVRTFLIGDDYTESRREEERLKLEASVMESTDQAVVITDAAASILTINHAFTELTGYSKEDVVGNNPRILQSGRHDSEFYKQMWKSLVDTDHWRGDVWDRRKDGSIYPKFLSISAIRNKANEVTHYAGIFYEVSERKAIEERLDFLAHYDTLTGLPNRRLLMDRFELAIGRAKRNQTRIGILYLDLDHFKRVNDRFGHHAGDSLLHSVAQRLKTCVRAVDVVARLGGDEFMVLLPDIRKFGACARVAQKILETLTPPYDVDGVSVVATPSIGISIYPDDHHEMEALMRHADAAMYEAKHRWHAKFRFFHEMENSTPADM
jgi:diguanylate cyclase (GGDEF)-like protein/PAS domain S-box-containing protein